MTDLLHRMARNMGAMWAHAARASGGRDERWDDVWVADAGAPNGVMNRGTILRPGVDGAHLAARLKAFYGDDPTRPYAILDPWASADLSAAGFERIFDLPCMTIDAGARAPDGAHDIAVERVTDEETLEAFRHVVFNGFTLVPWPEGEHTLFGPTFCSHPDIRVWLGRLDGDPVGSSVSFRTEGIVGVYLVATLPAFRGRGIGEALSWAATLADPAVPAVLQASAMGKPVYDRMGYREVARAPVWVKR